jgi:hypothetical protein
VKNEKNLEITLWHPGSIQRIEVSSKEGIPKRDEGNIVYKTNFDSSLLQATATDISYSIHFSVPECSSRICFTSSQTDRTFEWNSEQKSHQKIWTKTKLTNSIKFFSLTMRLSPSSATHWPPTGRYPERQTIFPSAQVLTKGSVIGQGIQADVTTSENHIVQGEKKEKKWRREEEKKRRREEEKENRRERNKGRGVENVRKKIKGERERVQVSTCCFLKGITISSGGLSIDAVVEKVQSKGVRKWDRQ